MKAAPEIRDCTEDDLGAVQAIYDHHVRTGLASFEETAPDAEEMARRRAAVLGHGLPYIVGLVDGAVGGFAYALPYRARPAYGHTVENSVYVDPGAMRHGLGRRLLEELVERCTALGYRQMVAVIGDSANTASIELHAGLGFEPAGHLRSIGFKLGRWVDTVIMQRPLGAGDATLPGA